MRVNDFFNMVLKYVSTIKLLCWYFSVFTRKRNHWLIPKKIRKVRISEKIFDHNFQWQKLTQFFENCVGEKNKNLGFWVSF